MYLCIEGNGLDLNSGIINDLKDCNLELVHYRANGTGDGGMPLLIFDLEPGVEFVDVFDRWSGDNQIFDVIRSRLKSGNKTLVHFLNESKASKYPAIRMIAFDDLEMRVVLESGTVLDGSLVGDDEYPTFKGELHFFMRNVSDATIGFKQTNQFLGGFKLDDINGDEVLDLQGADLDPPIERVLDAGDEIDDVVNFTLRMPPNVYAIQPYTSWLIFTSGERRETRYTFPPIQIIAKFKA
ncbi:MAG: hypothetical protein ACTSWN_04790 [Promethearchaeota archaeon]